MAASDFIASSLYVEALAPPGAAQRSALREFFQVAITAIEIAMDCATCIFALVAVHLLTTSFPASSFFWGALRNALPPGAASGLIVVALFYRDGVYCKNKGLLQIRETERAIRVSVKASFLLLCIRLLFRLEVSWPQLSVSLFALPTLLIIEKQVLSLFVRRLQRNVRFCDRAVIYGTPRELSRRVISTLLQSPRLGLHPVAIVDDSSACSECSIREMGYRGCRSIQVERRPLSPSLLRAYRCDVLLLIVSGLSSDEITAATHAAQQAGSGVAYLRDSVATDQPCVETIDVDGILFSTSRERSGVWFYLLAKRVIDIVVSSILIALMLPLLILIAILVRLDSPGPVLFVQRRVGRNGELFDMFKIRSMFTYASKYAKSPTTSNDPRITRVGRVLRRLSLDELPQLFNVLTGAMSLVGPRPEMPFIVETYDVRQRSRLKVKPGITGIWQLSADRSFPIHQNLEYDFYYIRNWTLSMDAAILIHTLIFALRGGI